MRIRSQGTISNALCSALCAYLPYVQMHLDLNKNVCATACATSSAVTLLDNPGDSSFWTVSPAVLRLEYEISRIIAEGCHFFSRLDSVLTIKFQIFYVV